MHQDAGIVVAVVRVAADVRPLVHDQDALAQLRREALGDHTAGEARTDDQCVESMTRRCARDARAVQLSIP